MSDPVEPIPSELISGTDGDIQSIQGRASVPISDILWAHRIGVDLIPLDRVVASLQPYVGRPLSSIPRNLAYICTRRMGGQGNPPHPAAMLEGIDLLPSRFMGARRFF